MQDIADDERGADSRVVERLDAQMIPRAEQLPAVVVPEAERKVAEQVCDALGAPSLVRGEYELHISGVGQRAPKLRLQPPDERSTVIHTPIHHDAQTIIAAERARFLIVR